MLSNTPSSWPSRRPRGEGTKRLDLTLSIRFLAGHRVMEEQNSRKIQGKKRQPMKKKFVGLVAYRRRFRAVGPSPTRSRQGKSSA